MVLYSVHKTAEPIYYTPNKFQVNDSNKKMATDTDTVETTSTAVVYIINKFRVKNQSQAFHCIMIYQDVDSGFCFIRPLLNKIDLEISMELFKIFTSYGPPKEMHINSCTQDVVKLVESNIVALYPKFKIEYIKKNSDKNDLPLLIVAELHKWMEKTNKDHWELGCCIVQRKLNTQKAEGKKFTPHQLFFKYSQNEDNDSYSESDSD